MLVNRLVLFFDGLSQKQILFLSYTLLALIASSDFLAGHKYAASIFYLIPIAVVVWYGSIPLAVSVTLISALAWYSADYLALRVDEKQIDQAVLIWNSAIRLASFSIMALLINQFRNMHQLEYESAHRDALTGALNFRACHERLEEELYRASRNRKSFSYAVIDLDNFKSVNDSFGHSVGDELLQLISQHFLDNIRKTDFFARNGGDEFSLFLGDTSEAEAINITEMLYRGTSDLIHNRCWPVTLSIGLVTFLEPPSDVKKIVNTADTTMYKIKNNAKNGIQTAVWPLYFDLEPQTETFKTQPKQLV